MDNFIEGVMVTLIMLGLIHCLIAWISVGFVVGNPTPTEKAVGVTVGIQAVLYLIIGFTIMAVLGTVS